MVKRTKSMRQPAIFCETRFAASEVVVYRNFLRNYALYVTYFVEKSSVPPGRRKNRSKDEQKAFERLQLLRDMLFVGRVLVVHDMLSHIKKVHPTVFIPLANAFLTALPVLSVCTNGECSAVGAPGEGG